LRGEHFRIEGIGNLRIKESNRIEALISEAAKLGFVFSSPAPDTLVWNGERCEVSYPIVIDTHDDHRMAMAFAPAALRYEEIWIDNPQVVSKSYPHFWDDLVRAGFTITHNETKENNTCL
jgi:3-phosphoshikimate 1-carboxyvinyltransferase